MLLDSILIAISVVLLCLLIRNKFQLEQFRKNSFSDEKKTQESKSDEFSLGLTKLNSEFTSQIRLDSLTGLPGREAFDDRLLQTLNQSKRFKKSFAVVLLDISDFHIFNEKQGYETGDKVLREVAQRLQGVIRQIDTMTRYTGDDFMFLLPELSMPETAVYVVQRLLDNIVLPFQINDKNLYITANVGVSIYPSDGDDIKTILNHVNDALEKAKISGKNRYQFYQQEIHALSQRELSLNTFLCAPDMLKKLLINYQPYVNILTGEVVCVEATPCIPLPNFDQITFLEFSKIAENRGKIIEIGEWLLKNAIVQLKKWEENGFKAKRLAVNITLRQIEDSQFIYKISQILQKYQINPKQIIFEVIGESILSNTASFEKNFSILEREGIQIALSIFALGNFALQKITKLPINYLKIDNRLLQEGRVHHQSEVILHTLITLAKDMNISIVAEGVDTEKQKNFLHALGCEVMQGKLFGNPLPIEEVVVDNPISV
jgi:diguanylate cyclase (GGDEF)-like protein